MSSANRRDTAGNGYDERAAPGGINVIARSRGQRLGIAARSTGSAAVGGTARTDATPPDRARRQKLRSRVGSAEVADAIETAVHAAITDARARGRSLDEVLAEVLTDDQLLEMRWRRWIGEAIVQVWDEQANAS